MPSDSRYDPLYEPVGIGPLTAKSRFYQAPHATGTGYAMPPTLTALREVKAEFGWAVECTEYCSVRQSSENSSCDFATL